MSSNLNQTGLLVRNGSNMILPKPRNSNRSLSPFNATVSYYNAIHGLKQKSKQGSMHGGSGAAEPNSQPNLIAVLGAAVNGGNNSLNRSLNAHPLFVKKNSDNYTSNQNAESGLP